MALFTSRRIRLVLAAFTTAGLCATSLAEYQDCRLCHYAVTPDSTAPDYTDYFIAPGHHPVHALYPSRIDYNPATAISGDILFFDLDGDGLPGLYEVQIFRTANGDRIECSSCHREHGTTTTTTTTSPSRSKKKTTTTTSSTPAMYLRSDPNTAKLCLFCHNL